MLAETKLAQRVHRWMALSCLALIAVTWRLWTPQTVFPQVPAFESFCSAPVWIDWCCLIGLIVGLALIAQGSSGNSAIIAWMMVLISLGGFFCLDQHRLQPWAYQLFLFALIGLCCRPSRQLKLIILLLVSVYFYSGLSKVDFEFLRGMGPQMLGALFRLVGQNSEQLSSALRMGLAASLPFIELVIAIAMVFPESRRIAGILAMGMHAVLIMILGPIGLQHGPSVLIWNLQFAVLAYLLFVVKRQVVTVDEPNPAAFGSRRSQWKRYAVETSAAVCSFTIALACFLPLGERFGVWDHWPSWALYAPHSSRVRVYVARTSMDRLPQTLRLLMEPDLKSDEVAVDWVPIPIDRWSLRALGAPIYPQSRFQLGVARHLSNTVDSEFEMQIVILKCAHRVTGNRITSTLEYGRQIDEAAKQFWLNTKPRCLEVQ